MDRFLAECMGVDPLKDKAATSALYRRFGRAAKDVLALSGGDIEKAMQGVHGVGAWLQGKGLSWTLDTVAKHITDYQNNPGGFYANSK